MSRSRSSQPLRVGMIALGCAKNLVDAEIMLGTLLRAGVEITNDPTVADAVIVNTCSFIDAAQEESVDTILESTAVREARHRGQAVIVAGCLSQRYREELPKLFPEVDAFMGIDQVTRVGELVREAIARREARIHGAQQAPQPVAQPSKARINRRLAALDRAYPESPGSVLAAGPSPGNPGKLGAVKAASPVLQVDARPTYIPDYGTPRFRLTPGHLAYVKIAEGCNHPCSFCIIPRMRGSHRSRPMADVVEEARRLVAEGVKELNLISQDSTYYGLDLRRNHSRAIASPDRFRAAAGALPADAPTLARLLRELNALPGEFWIRLLYTHPAHWTDELIETMAGCPKVVRYVDMPLQHIDEVMLQRMRRETSRAHIEDLIRRIRAGVPGIALRTTFIVGFPGETEAMFRSLLQFIRETRFERLGVFTYSREEGTIAGRMGGQVTTRVRQRRREQAMSAQHEVARHVASEAVGRELKVLVEAVARDRQLQTANVFNWEHGFIRDSDPSGPRLGRAAYCVARGEADAPDIDGRVYVRGKLPVGEFAKVRVVGHTDYDLIAVPV